MFCTGRKFVHSGLHSATGRNSHNVRTILSCRGTRGPYRLTLRRSGVRSPTGCADSIAAGEFGPGDVLPSETEINATFQVSRATARASLERLRHEGLIRRQSGRGSIVLAPKVEQPVNELASFSEDMRRRGLRPSYSTFSAESAPARGDAAEALEICATARSLFTSAGFCSRTTNRLACLSRGSLLGSSWRAGSRRRRNSTPDLCTNGWRGSVGRKSPAQKNTSRPLWPTRRWRADSKSRRDRLSSSRAAARTPMDGRPIEYATMHYRADRYRFIIELAGSSASQRTQ